MSEKKKKPEGPSFTTEKRSDGFLFLASEFNYVDGRRTTLKRDGIFVELNRGVEFNPAEYLATFRGFGWRPGEALKLATKLTEALELKADDRTTRVCRWKDRIRPEAQIRLEGELSLVEEQNAKLLELLDRAATKDPEILELKRKVLGEAA